MLEQANLEGVCGTYKIGYWWGSYENDGGVAELQRNTWTANPILLGMFSRTMAEVAIANDF
jgi:hypothetical protein